ncbi:MAG: DNA mismatch repair endonuclease MutL [Gammaproteobacteria bacterium]
MSTAVITKFQIHRLPKQLANQIAAGEVVERPASIVKELLENSIDAGATRIEIDIEKGGTRSILIRDNGCGIPGDQLMLAVSRHATSKISSLDDLENLYSMGFRGEALASIGSVSRMLVTSCYENEEQGWQLVCDNLSEDNEGELGIASHPQGTSIHVTNLFYNAPARRKFLRSERTEYQHIEEVVRRMALSRFDIQFQLTHNQRQIFNLPAVTDNEGQLRRLQRLCGKAFTETALAIEFEHNGLKLSGWLAPAEQARPQADLQYFFVNQRIIRDRVISHAIRQAYADRIYPGRYPAYVLNLEMPPQQVDVNVHPTKHEVRFRENRLVHDFLFRCLSQALETTSAVATDTTPTVSEPFYKPAMGNVPYASGVEQTKEVVEERYTDYTTSDYEAITELYGKYLLVQNRQHYYLVEISNALQAIYAMKLQQASRPLRALPILFPLSVQVEQQQAQWVELNEEVLVQWGMDISRIGEQDIMLRSLPTLFADVDSEQFIKALFRQQPDDDNGWINNLSQLAAQYDQRDWTLDTMQLLVNEMHHYQLWQQASSSTWTELDETRLAKLFNE